MTAMKDDKGSDNRRVGATSAVHNTVRVRRFQTDKSNSVAATKRWLQFCLPNSTCLKKNTHMLSSQKISMHLNNKLYYFFLIVQKVRINV